jgi:hypothetical protein
MEVWHNKNYPFFGVQARTAYSKKMEVWYNKKGNLSVGHSSFVAWFGKYCSGCFCLLDIVISSLGLWNTVWCLLDKFILGCFCLLDTTPHPIDQGMKLWRVVDRNISNNIWQTKPQTKNVTQTNFPNKNYPFLGVRRYFPRALGSAAGLGASLPQCGCA